MPNKFSSRSKARLDTCHPSLRDLFTEVLKRRDITIACGHRNQEDQNKAFTEGKSLVKYPYSRHNQYPSLAVDVVPYPELWSSDEAFEELAEIVKEEAEKLGVAIDWGGDWTSFVDKPHWELRG